MTRFIALVVLVAGLPQAGPAQTPQQKIPMRMPAEKAQATAQAFYKKTARFFGAPPQPGEAFRPSTVAGNGVIHFYTPHWVVTNKEGIEICVQDSTGQVVDVSDNGAPRVQEARRMSWEKRAPLSSAELRKRALGFKALFVGSETLPDPPREDDSEPGTAWAGRTFRWGREYKSVPFQNQGLSITLDVYTGAVRMAKLSHWSPLPGNTEEKIDKQAAEKIALEKVRSMLDSNPVVVRSSKQILLRNSFLQDKKSTSDLSASYFGWVVIVAASKDSRSYTLVGVDAQTGEIINGGSEAPRYRFQSKRAR